MKKILEILSFTSGIKMKKIIRKWCDIMGASNKRGLELFYFLYKNRHFLRYLYRKETGKNYTRSLFQDFRTVAKI